MNIGLIGNAADPCIQRLCSMIESRRATPFLVDSSRFPEQTCLSLASWGMTANGRSIEEVKVWHVRGIYTSFPVFKMEDGEYALFKDWRAKYLAGREEYSMISSWIRLLSLWGHAVINPIESFDYHFLKPLHIESLRRQGFPLPQTLVTNDPEQLKAFAEAHARVIYKPVSGGAYCHELQPEDLAPERLELLRNAPVIFQERIEGQNIRAVVVGDSVVSAALIHSQAVDYRGNEEGFESVSLPGWVETMCVKAAHASRMRFAGIDLIRSSRGYTLLECNPTPVYLGIEQLLGHAISEALVDMFINEGRARVR